MTDFETFVRDMVKNGASAEEIAKQTTGILNAIQKEKEDTDGREATLAKYREMINLACTNKEFSIPEAAAACAITGAGYYPEWGKKEIEEFYNTMRQTIRVAASNVGKNPAQIFENAFKDFINNAKINCNCRQNETKNKKTSDPTANPKRKYPEESLRHLLDLIWE